MREVKAARRVAILRAVACLLAAAPPAAAGVQTWGRRLAVGPNDLLVLTEPDRDRVAVFDVAQDAPRKLAEFGARGERPGLLHAPHGAAFDGRGGLVVADSFNHRLQSFDLQRLLNGHGPRLVRAWGAFGRGAGELDTPVSGLAVLPGPDGNDLLFVADTRNHRVVAFDRAGRSSGLVLGGRGAKGGQLDGPSGLAIDPGRSLLYVAEQGNRRVSAFDVRSGAFLFAFGQPAAGPGGLSVPVDVAVDARGDVWVVDQGARRVVRFSPVAGAKGSPRGVRAVGSWGRSGAGLGAWDYPQAIAVDSRRRVYVADRIGGRCQYFSADGKLLGVFAADVGAGDPESFGPAPVAPAAGPLKTCSNGGRYGLSVRSRPEPLPLNDYFSLDVEVQEGCAGGAPAAGVGLEVDARMPEHVHGMNTLARVVRRADAAFLVSGLLFHMPGRWELYLDVVRDGVLERAQVDLSLR